MAADLGLVGVGPHIVGVVNHQRAEPEHALLDVLEHVRISLKNRRRRRRRRRFRSQLLIQTCHRSNQGFHVLSCLASLGPVAVRWSCRMDAANSTSFFLQAASRARCCFWDGREWASNDFSIATALRK